MSAYEKCLQKIKDKKMQERKCYLCKHHELVTGYNNESLGDTCKHGKDTCHNDDNCTSFEMIDDNYLDSNDYKEIIIELVKENVELKNSLNDVVMSYNKAHKKNA